MTAAHNFSFSLAQPQHRHVSSLNIKWLLIMAGENNLLQSAMLLNHTLLLLNLLYYVCGKLASCIIAYWHFLGSLIEVLSGHKATLQISDMEWNEVKLLAFTSQLCWLNCLWINIQYHQRGKQTGPEHRLTWYLCLYTTTDTHLRADSTCCTHLPNAFSQLSFSDLLRHYQKNQLCKNQHPPSFPLLHRIKRLTWTQELYCAKFWQHWNIAHYNSNIELLVKKQTWPQFNHMVS